MDGYSAASLFSALLGDRQNQLVIVGSTLPVAVLLNPVRHRVQNLIDLRFYRQKYNSRQVLANFNARMNSGREDTAGIKTLITEALEETLQPESAIIWLKVREYPAESEG